MADHDREIAIMQRPFYIRLQSEKVVSTQRVHEEIILDLDADGNVIGIEIL